MADRAAGDGASVSQSDGFAHLLVSETDGVGWVRFNRPRVRNALNQELIEEFVSVLERFDDSPEVRVIVISGDERAFSAGADTSELALTSTVPTNATPMEPPRVLDMALISKPIIAAVAGYALGGGSEIVLMADLVIAAKSAKFGFPEIRLGIMPGAGGTQRLPRVLGPMKAADLILTGRYISATEAERSGLVSRVVPDSALDATVRDVATEMATRPLAVLRSAKQALRVAVSEPIERGLELEQKIWHNLREQS